MTRDRILPKKPSREKQAVTLKSAIWAKMNENVQKMWIRIVKEVEKVDNIWYL